MDRDNDDDPTIGEMRRRRPLAEPCVSDELVDDEPNVLGPVSPENDIIARARASGKTQKEAGALVNLSERTVRRREKNPAVRRLKEEYRWENRDRFAALVDAVAPKAVETVAAELKSDDPRIRMRAGRELMNIELRLSARPESIDPGHIRAVYGAVLDNFLEASRDLLPDDLLQKLLGRMRDLNALTEMLAAEDEPIMNLKLVVEKLDPSEAPKEYWEVDEDAPDEEGPDLDAGNSRP
jgi:hypothetical protein